MPGLLDNQAGTPALSGAVSNDQQYANCFTVSETTVFHRVDWYAVTNDVANAPASIRLWRADNSTQVQAITTIPQQAGPGWQSIQLGDPITCSAGIEYRLGWHASNGRKVAVWAADPTVDPPAPMAWSTSDKSLQRASATLIPNAGWVGTAAVSLHTDDAPTNNPPPSQPPNNTGLPITADLAYWLHKDTSNPDSAVKLIHDWLLEDASAYLAKLTTIEGATAVIGSASSSGDTTAMGRLATIITLVTALASVTDDVASAITTILGWTEDQGAPTALILDRLAYLQESIGLDMARRNEAITPEVWTLVDTLEWDGPFTWDVPADRYRLHVETVGPFRPVNVVAGVDVLYRSGWWSLLTDTVADERRWLSFRDQDLWVPGVRAPGILVHPWPEATGTLQAWQRNAPTP